jgi:hypothetical protein
LNVLVAPYFGCLCVCRGVVFCFLFLDGKMVDFAGHFCIVLVFSALGNDVDHALSSWKRGVAL